LSLEVIIKSGAVCAFVGICFFVILIALLLAFPVLEHCIAGTNCKYLSKAPEPFLSLINPGFAFVSLSLIAAGVLMLRLGSYYKYRK
jgi:uncharacterized membrane protein YwaF